MNRRSVLKGLQSSPVSSLCLRRECSDRFLSTVGNGAINQEKKAKSSVLLKGESARAPG